MSDATTALAEVLRAHLTLRESPAQIAAAVVAAVRGMSPDLQAEVIGGVVEWVDRGMYLNGTLVEERCLRRRPVGPWTPGQAEEGSDG